MSFGPPGRIEETEETPHYIGCPQATSAQWRTLISGRAWYGRSSFNLIPTLVRPKHQSAGASFLVSTYPRLAELRHDFQLTCEANYLTVLSRFMQADAS